MIVSSLGRYYYAYPAYYSARHTAGSSNSYDWYIGTSWVAVIYFFSLCSYMLRLMMSQLFRAVELWTGSTWMEVTHFLLVISSLLFKSKFERIKQSYFSCSTTSETRTLFRYNWVVYRVSPIMFSASQNQI